MWDIRNDLFSVFYALTALGGLGVIQGPQGPVFFNLWDSPIPLNLRWEQHERETTILTGSNLTMVSTIDRHLKQIASPFQ